jgi:hypothetical protein
MHSTNIYNKQEGSGYLSVFFFLPAARCHSDMHYPIWWYVLMYIFSGKAEEGKEKKTYFGTSGYSQEDIAAAVLFADELSRGDIHTYISYYQLNRFFKE